MYLLELTEPRSRYPPWHAVGFLLFDHMLVKAAKDFAQRVAGVTGAERNTAHPYLWQGAAKISWPHLATPVTVHITPIDAQAYSACRAAQGAPTPPVCVDGCRVDDLWERECRWRGHPLPLPTFRQGRPRLPPGFFPAK